MKEIEKIYGYTLVEDNGKYGLMSADRKILVPFEMDNISGYEDEMVSECESWISDVYMDCVYVQSGDLYGCIEAPDFKFKELTYAETPFSEIS